MADTTKTTHRAASAVLRPGTLTGPAGAQALGLLSFMSDAGAQGAAGDAGGDAGDAGTDGTDAGTDGDTGDQGTDGGEDDGQEDKSSKAVDPKTAAARDEAAQNRIKAREADERASAAETALAELTQKVGKILGLAEDDEDKGGDAPDVDALAKSVAEEQAKASEAARELAVYKAARDVADPDRLLDSRRFLTSISEIDPSDGDAVSAAVKAAVDSDPTLAPRRERGASSADTASGPGGGSAPKAEVGLQAALGNHYGTN